MRFTFEEECPGGNEVELIKSQKLESGFLAAPVMQKHTRLYSDKLHVSVDSKQRGP